MPRHWILALAAASACSGQVRVQAPRAERLGAIRIAGNHAIATSALEPALALHEAIGEGAAIDPYLLTLDTDRIRAAYVRRGFFAVQVTASIEQRGAGQVAVFRVIEGLRAVARVEISGLPPEVAPGAARALVAIRDGAPFEYDAYDAAKRPLTELVQNAGYAHAEVRGTVIADADARGAAVRYDIVAGVPCRFGAIRLPAGLHPALVDAVRSRLRFAPGDRYSASALAASQAELYVLGRFSAVQVMADTRGDGPVIDVAVELTPAKRHELHAGAGFGYESVSYEARVRGGGSLVPAAQPLLTLAADARVALTIPHSGQTGKIQPKLRILGSVQRLDLGLPRLRGELEGGLDYQTVEAYTWAGGHVRIGLGSPLGPRWLQGRVGWVLEELTFSGLAAELDPDPSPDKTPPADVAAAREARVALGLAGSQRLGAFQASLVADLRDDPIEPRRGGYLSISAAVGTPFAGGELSYLQVTPELRGYLPLGKAVLAARARAGQILGDVPVTERYYSGGTSGQRGFSERQLAPRTIGRAPGCADTGPSATVIGGAGLVEAGVELRRQLASPGGVPIGANLFLDGADVTCRPDAIDPLRLQWAVGAGLWTKLAGLKIRTELGYRLNRKGSGELSGGAGALGDFAWHIGVGETY